MRSDFTRKDVDDTKEACMKEGSVRGKKCLYGILYFYLGSVNYRSLWYFRRVSFWGEGVYKMVGVYL